MPFALLIIGVVLLVASVRGSQDDLFALAKGDFQGQDNFAYWMVSILIIGALGYVPSLQKVSRMFLTLIVIALLISKKGFFTSFNQQVFSGSSIMPTQSSDTASSNSSSWIDNWQWPSWLEQPLKSPRNN